MAYGITNTLDTRFDTASVTKLFTAAAILLLVQEGALCLDDKITDVIDLSGSRIPADVTIELLLNHTSGIADDAEEENGEDYTALFVDKPNYSIRECKGFLPFFVNKPPNFRAGTNVRYNNCAFILLGLAIEKLSGMPYRDFVQKRIFQACNMQNSHFCAMDDINPNTAEGYICQRDPATGAEQWKKNIYAYPPIGTADGGAYTTVRDLATFFFAIQNGQLLQPAYAKMLMQPQCVYSRPHRHGTWTTGYAFEFIVKDQNVFCMYKDGNNAGVEAMLAYYPQHDLLVSLLSNQNSCLYDLHREIQDYLSAVRT